MSVVSHTALRCQVMLITTSNTKRPQERQLLYIHPRGGFLGGGGGGDLVCGGAGPGACPAWASGTGSSRLRQKGPGGLPPKLSNNSVLVVGGLGTHSPELTLPAGSALLRY